MEFQNKLYTNDNLFILNGLNSNLVDLIYLDPPFNSKRMYSAPIGSKAAGASFKDMWTWKDVNEYYLETLAEKYPALQAYIALIGLIHSKAMMAYLTYMAQRIIELHRILKDTGSLYLHCDPTASHYLKVILDEIFGEKNFKNEITWKRNEVWKKYSDTRYDVAADIIFFYTKTDKYTYKPQFIKSTNDPSNSYKKADKYGRKYREVLITGHKSLGRSSNYYQYKGYTPEYGWTVDIETLTKMDEQGLLVWRNGVCKNYIKYLDERQERINNIWIDIISARGKERTGYPTQKPLALLHRIIEASSNEDDIILDPFCGCATTCVAAQQLGRKWIGIDIEKQAVDVLIERLSDDAMMFKDFINVEKPPQRTDVQIVEPKSIPVRERLYKEQNGLCNGCGVQFELRNLETDHIIPESKGGGSYYENYQLLCSSCNKIKGNRPMEYLRKKIAVRKKLLEDKLFFGE